MGQVSVDCCDLTYPWKFLINKIKIEAISAINSIPKTCTVDIYLQTREYEIKDGNLDDAFDDFGDYEDFEEYDDYYWFNFSH